MTTRQPWVAVAVLLLLIAPAQEAKAQRGPRNGVHVVEVLPGSPAEYAGLTAGSWIIQVDDVITDSGCSLRYAIHRASCQCRPIRCLLIDPPTGNLSTIDIFPWFGRIGIGFNIEPLPAPESPKYEPKPG